MGNKSSSRNATIQVNYKVDEISKDKSEVIKQPSLKEIPIQNQPINGSKRGIAHIFKENEIINNKYQVIKFIDQGTYGQVYKVKKIIDGQELAIKILMQKNKTWNLEFEKEKNISAMATPVSKGLIPFYDHGQYNGRSYVVVEFIEGKSLFKRFIELHMTGKEFVFYYKQIAKSMKEFHELALVHKDIKGSNIMISRDEKCFLGDYGTSQKTNLEDVNKKNNGKKNKSLDVDISEGVVGTVTTVAPESILEPKKYDFRSDIYSLGMTMYNTLTGTYPIKYWESEKIAKQLKKERFKTSIYHSGHLFGEFVPPHEYDPAIPECVSNIVMKCLARNLDERYQTMDEVLNDLENIDFNSSYKKNEVGQALRLKELRHMRKNNSENYRFNQMYKVLNFKVGVILSIIVILLLFSMILFIFI